MARRKPTPAGILTIAAICVFVAVAVLMSIEQNPLIAAVWFLVIVVAAAVTVAVTWRLMPPRRRWWPIPDRWGFRIDALLRWLSAHSRN